VAARRRFRVTHRARRDLEGIARWIGAQSGPERARLVLGRIMATCELFASQPSAGRAEPDLGQNVRSFLVHPYLVVYRPQGRSIEVLRIIHGARDRDAAWREPEGEPET
jgi:toxin ParE1/3/4